MAGNTIVINQQLTKIIVGESGVTLVVPESPQTVLLFPQSLQGPPGQDGVINWPLLAPDGSSSAPSYSFSGANGTGIYRTANDLKLITANNGSGEANNINIQAGSSGSGFGGGVTIRSGDAVDDTGGSFQITSGLGLNGGNFDMTSGEGLVGNGGNFSLVSGVGGTAGNGGFFTMASGGGLNGGDFFINAGEGTSDGGQGGNLTISAGLASGENEAFGGSVLITGGTVTTLSGNAGAVTIKGGASSGGATAGLLELEGGQSNTSGDAVGGAVTIKGGIGIRRAPVKIIDSSFVFASFTNTERNALTGLENGMVVYNTTTDKLQVYAGGAWVNLH